MRRKFKGRFSRYLNEDNHDLNKTIKKLEYMFRHPRRIDFRRKHFNYYEFCQFIICLYDNELFNAFMCMSFREYLKNCELDDDLLDLIYNSIRYGHCDLDEPCYSEDNNPDYNYFKSLDDDYFEDFFDNNIVDIDHEHDIDDKLMNIANKFYDFINIMVDDDEMDDEED